MPNRRSPLEGMDSLQMLLDPICNTFGGAVFMALLIALVGNRGGAAKPDEQAAARVKLAALAHVEAQEKSLADAQADSDDTSAREAALQHDIAAVAGRLGWTPDRVLALAAQYSGSADAVRAALDGGRALDDLAKQAAAKSADAKDAQAKLDEQQSRLHAAEQAVAAARAKSRLTLRMPAAHETTKRQAVAYVVHGRLYAGIYPEERFRFAAPLFRGVTRGDDKSIKPADLPDALGSPLLTTADGAAAAITAQGLAGLDANTDYVVFAVWPDSHEAFRLLRDAATARGLGYGLLLMDKDEAVSFGDSKSVEQ